MTPARWSRFFRTMDGAGLRTIQPNVALGRKILPLPTVLPPGEAGWCSGRRTAQTLGAESEAEVCIGPGWQGLCGSVVTVGVEAERLRAFTCTDAGLPQGVATVHRIFYKIWVFAGQQLASYGHPQRRDESRRVAFPCSITLFLWGAWPQSVPAQTGVPGCFSLKRRLAGSRARINGGTNDSGYQQRLARSTNKGRRGVLE